MARKKHSIKKAAPQPRPQKIGKALPIQSLMNFQLKDDHIVSQGEKYYLYRYFPPNADIMTDDEIAEEIMKFARALDTLRRPISLFITDKIEDLETIKRFYSSLPVEFDYITSEVISKLEDVEVKSTSVQRSYYYIYKPENDNDDIHNVLAGMGYAIQRAKKHEYVVLLRNYLLREFINFDIYTVEQEVKNLPKMNKAKQAVYDREIQRRLSPHRIDFGIFHAEQSGFLRKTIMVKNFPSEVPPTALMHLASLRNTTFNMRLTPMDKGVARKLSDQQIRNRQVMSGRNDKTKQIDAQMDEDIITKFYADISRNQNAIYHINVFIEMYGTSKAELRVIEERVHSELAGLAISYEELRYEQKDAFNSVQPLGRDLFLADSNNMPSTTIAALYPCSFSCRLDEQGMLLGTTAQGGDLFLDLWRRDDNITNGNFTVTGSPGQGKSYLMKKILTLNCIRGVSCYSLDPEDEYLELYRALGGTVLNCSNGTVRINPFEVRTLKTPLDDAGEDDGLSAINPDTPVFYQHLSWLADFFMVLFPNMEPKTHRALMIMVKDMYEANGITENSHFASLQSTDYPTFTQMWEYINNPTVDYGDLIAPVLVRDVKLYLKDCYDGAHGAIMNGHTNIKNAKMVCFSLGDLMEGSKERAQAMLFNITTYIWNIISKRENAVMLNIDELYLFLENTIMVKYIRSFAKRDRKYNAILGIGTQQLADCLNPKIATYTTALFNNASFQFMFYPGKMDLTLSKEHLKLTDGEEKCIAVSNKRHCLVRAGNDRYYIEVGSMDYEPMLFGKAGGV